MPQADYSGSVSGAKRDKINLSGYEIGEAGASIIKKLPLVMKGTVEYLKIGEVMGKCLSFKNGESI